MGLINGTPSIGFYDSKGEARLAMVAPNDEGPEIEFYDSEGKMGLKMLLLRTEHQELASTLKGKQDWECLLLMNNQGFFATLRRTRIGNMIPKMKTRNPYPDSKR